VGTSLNLKLSLIVHKGGWGPGHM